MLIRRLMAEARKQHTGKLRALATKQAFAIEPPRLTGMKELDRDAFLKEINVFGLEVSANASSDVRKRLIDCQCFFDLPRVV